MFEQCASRGRVAAALAPAQRHAMAQSGALERNDLDRGTRRACVGARQHSHSQTSGDDRPDSTDLSRLKGNAGYQPGFRCNGGDCIADGRSRWRNHKGVLAQIGHGDRLPSGEPMAGRHDGYQWLGRELSHGQAPPVGWLDDREDADIKSVFPQSVGEANAEVLTYHQLDRRMLKVKIAQQLDDIDRARRLGHTDRHLAGEHPAHLLKLVGGLSNLCEDRPRSFNEKCPRIRRGDMAGRAVKEGQAQFFLERSDLC